MDMYNIKFYKIEAWNEKHIRTSLGQANHFHVKKNKRRIGERNKLYKAIRIIIDNHGGNIDLETFMLNAHIYDKPYQHIECSEINFSDSEGIKMIFKTKTGGFND